MYFQGSVNYWKALWGIHSMCWSLPLHMMHTSACELLWFTGWYLEAVLPSVVTSNSISLCEWPLCSKATVCALWNSVCRNPDGGPKHSAVMGASQHMQRSVLFVQSLVVDSEPGKSVGWDHMKLHCEKGPCSVPTVLGDKIKKCYILFY